MTAIQYGSVYIFCSSWSFSLRVSGTSGDGTDSGTGCRVCVIASGNARRRKASCNARGYACPFLSGTKVTTVLWRFIELDGDEPSLGIELAREGSFDAFQGFAICHP